MDNRFPAAFSLLPRVLTAVAIGFLCGRFVDVAAPAFITGYGVDVAALMKSAARVSLDAAAFSRDVLTFMGAM
jgi:hypothetical protein